MRRWSEAVSSRDWAGRSPSVAPLKAQNMRRLLAALVAAVVVLVPGTAHAEDIRGEEWQMPMLHYTQAWGYASGAGVTVAVLDSGVDATHPDLAGRVLAGIDLVDGTTDGRKDFVGHGTSVADLIAGRKAGDGVVGLAYGAKILPVRVLDANNRYEDAQTIASGVRWAVDHGAEVINLSLGGASDSEPLAAALKYAAAHNVVVVACAGNVADHAGTGVWYPARAPGVVAVAGLTSGERFWTGSVSGPQVALSAPADGLVGAKPGGYWHVQGTSFAAPLVSATAALIKSKWPSMSAANVVNRMIATADDLGPTGRDREYGYGIVDPARALSATVTSVGGNPLESTSPSSGGGAAAAAPSPAATTPSAEAAPANQHSTTLVLLAVAMLLATATILFLLIRRTRHHPY